MYLLKKLFKGDPVIWIIFAILCVYSLVFVFSATSTIVYKNDNMLGPITRHFGMLALGFTFGILVTHNIPYRFFKIGGLVLPLVVLLLIYTIFFGVEINGEKRWLEIFGIQFQPSELAKLSLISYIALVLSKRGQLTDQQIFVWILGGAFAVCAAIRHRHAATETLINIFFISNVLPVHQFFQISCQLHGHLAVLTHSGMPARRIAERACLRRHVEAVHLAVAGLAPFSRHRVECLLHVGELPAVEHTPGEQYDFGFRVDVAQTGYKPSVSAGKQLRVILVFAYVVGSEVYTHNVGRVQRVVPTLRRVEKERPPVHCGHTVAAAGGR